MEIKLKAPITFLDRLILEIDKVKFQESNSIEDKELLNICRKYRECLEHLFNLTVKYNRQTYGVDDYDSLSQKSLWINLKTIMMGKTISVNEIVDIFIRAGIFKDRRTASNQIYTTFYYHKKEIFKVGKGIYRIQELSGGYQRTYEEA